MNISIIHPTRARASKSLRTTIAWSERVSGKYQIELLVSIDEDDPEMSLYQAYPKLIINKNRSAIDAINNAAKVSTGNILMVVSDDTDCPQNWDESIINAFSMKDAIMKVNDGIQPWIITMPVMDRAYYNRFGYIYHPDYQHMFCDTELTCVADIIGRKIHTNLLFPHKHYSVTKEPPDAIAKRNDSTWTQGEKLFLERYARNFDLPPGGKIQDNGMINWLKLKHAKA